MCWSGHRGVRESWSVERREPAATRVSDADRERVIEQLSHHTGEGRLTLEEFEARVDETWRSKTRGDLRHVLRELPAERRSNRDVFLSWQVRAIAFWSILILAAVIAFGIEATWWLIPLAWFKLGGFGRRWHHHDHRHEPPTELSRGDDLTLV